MIRGFNRYINILIERVKSYLVLFQLYKLKKNRDKIIVVLTEHLGDIIACSPVAEYLFNLKSGDVLWVINKKYKIVLENNPYIQNTILVNNLGGWVFLNKCINFLKIDKLKIYNLHFNGRECEKSRFININLSDGAKIVNFKNYYKYGTILESFCRIADLPVIDFAPVLYFDINDKLNKNFKYVVIHTSSNDKNRNWHPQGWADLCHYIIEFTDYTIIEVGLTKSIKLEERYHDFTGYKELEKIASLINNSNLFIGVDSGFAHIANAYLKHSLIILGRYNDFDNYMPYNGFFKKNEKSMIFRFNECLSVLDFIKLKPFLKNSLKFED